MTPDGSNFVYSETVGIIRTRTQISMISVWTHRYPTVVQVINKWAKQQGWIEDNFCFSSLTINKNFLSKLHRDGNNNGLSMIVACGDYKGGCLKYFPMGDGNMAIDLVDEKDSDKRNINCNPFYFDGTKAHGTEPFEGTGIHVSSIVQRKVNRFQKINIPI